ncbi:Gfo/Idh/MocA family oxidoreductase [Streptomyces sp. NPDC005799]|uniref:Gfo/Idh/MocA family protein n=1 Tax=Streptomyces sp. NPDC005799 TaxID=3154678 RepID=UPI0033C22F3D
MANWGFLGAGSIARSSLAPAVRAAKGAVLHAVASSSHVRAQALRPERAYPSYDDLLRDPDVDIVYIALHNSAHIEWTRRALRAGKHVLCEKPLGLSAAEVDAMTRTAREAGRLLIEAAWNRWHPRTRDLETMIDGGSIGAVQTVTARFDGLEPTADNYRLNPNLGGGALYDVGYYAVSAALAAFGWNTPQVVWAKQEQWHPASADSASDFLLEFPCRGTAQIHCALIGRMAEELVVTGTSGTLSLSSPAFCAGATSVRLFTGSDSDWQARSYPALDSYRLMVDAMDAAVEGRGHPYLVSPQQSRLIAATIDAVREALPSHSLPDTEPPKQNRRRG